MNCMSISGCENKAFKELDCCALHCSEKDINKDEFHEYLMEFYKLFSDYLDREIQVEISRNRCESHSEFEARDELEKIEKDIEDYHLLIGGIAPYGISNRLTKRLEKIDIILKGYRFPNDDNMEHLGSEYHQVLRCLGRVGFLDCNFNTPSFNLNSNFYYKDCIFYNDLIITPFPEVEDKDYRYINCKFEKDVFIKPSKKSREISCNLFKDCNFEEDITLSNINFKETVLHLSQPLENVSMHNVREHFSKVKSNFKFKNIKIEECIFESGFKLNGFDKKYLEMLKFYKRDLNKDWLEISSLKIIDTEFNSKFEVKNRIIKNLDFINSNVLKIFDVYGSKIEKTNFEKNIFYDFAGFENVVFGSKDKTARLYRAKFEYTTFESFSSFRNTKFYSGLDFKNTNRDKEPNFLNSYINSQNTDRETFRIVKYSFDSVGNKIEAGKYHAYEMSAYINELSFKKNFWQLTILYANNLISKFGQSYIRPFLLLIGFVVLYSYLLDSYQEVLQFRIHEMQYGLESFTENLNTGARNFLPFARFISDKRGFEFVSLFFYIVFAVCIWQIIVAVKKQTQH